MKRLVLVALLAAMLATPAMAGQFTVRATGLPGGYGPYQTGQGGEFTFQLISVPGETLPSLSGYVMGKTMDVAVGRDPSFQTFCIEGNEYVEANTTYHASLDQFARNGGMTGQTQPNKDYVSVGTGWLYGQFATGIWTGGLSYNYGPGRTTSASLLQKAIWWLEGEDSIAYDSSNAYMAAVMAKFGSASAAKADGGWNYGVYALNIWTGSGTGIVQKQTQLFHVPDGGTTLMLLGGALLGLGALRRRLGA